MMEVAEIAERFNQLAPSLAPQLLPNGHRSGSKWMASGIADTGHSASLAVSLAGSDIGHWRDYGNAPADEQRGDMLDLVRLIECGGDAAAAVAWAKRELGIADDFHPGAKSAPSAAERERRAAEARRRAEQRERELEAERRRNARNAKRLYLSGRPIAGTGADLYLQGRAIAPLPGSKPWPGSLRFRDGVPYKPLQIEIPAMLAAIFDAAGNQIGTHRTYLQDCPRRGWCKIDHDPAKMVLGNMWGGFVPVHKGRSGKSMRAMAPGEPVYITEGIEDALCVRMLKPEARIVAAISLANIGGIILPERARDLVIVADRDDNPQAQDTLERAIARQESRGLRVSLVVPPELVNGERLKDLNDWVRVLLGSGAGRQRA